MYLLNRRIKVLLYSFVIMLITISCKDDPIEPTIDHFEAEGLVLYQSGIKVAEIFRGVTEDTLIAVTGQTSDHFEVKFYNRNKQELEPPNHNTQPFSWEIQDTILVEIWQHPGEEGSYEFHLVGKQSGLTQVEFFIMHEGHADFRSGKMPVKIVNE